MTPANRVAHNRSPLLRRMFEDGLARPKLMIGPNGAPVTASAWTSRSRRTVRWIGTDNRCKTCT